MNYEFLQSGPLPQQHLLLILKLYQYHTKVANHYFCTECGIYTHHNPRSAPVMTGFNLGCVDEVNVEDLNEIAFFDGKNHPMDQKK